MKKRYALTFLIIPIFHNNIYASAIIQCTQPDGTIEFTNQGCSKSNSFNSSTNYKNNSSHSLVKKNTRKSAPFRRASFIQLQKKLIKSKTQKETELHARIITEKVNSYAQNGKLKNAYDMIAATYVSLSKHIKKRQWEGLQIETQTINIRSLFEDILITQSTISTASELNLAIENAWKNHQTIY